MTQLRTTAPADEAAFRQAVYAGEIFLLPGTATTRRLTAEVMELIAGEFGTDGPVREAQFRRTDAEFFQAVGRLRKVLYQGEHYFATIRRLLVEFGFDPAAHALDPLRMRVMADGAYRNPKAAPIYYTHRDTWYAHPQCQISWWIPLHDVTEADTFVFYPEYFDRPVENDSGDFDYDSWIRDRRSLRIGWQNPNAGTEALYPGFRGALPPTETIGFSARAGDVLIFAGAHLHRTLPNDTGRTRFSIDFRTAHLGDYAASLGAPNADNRSTGTALIDYMKPEEGIVR